MVWHPDQYLRFEEERTRPCRDLVTALPLQDPGDVIDLGCGPGNSTVVLAERWPAARITALDSSLDMVRRAQQSGVKCELIHGDISEWAAETERYDLVFSNAALHWVGDHATLLPRLMGRVRSGGVLAVQMPDNLNEAGQRTMLAVAESPGWREQFPAEGVRQWFVHEAEFYYDVLAPFAKRINIWRSTYLHVMPDVAAIGEWYRSTGLRPFLGALRSDEEREEFVRDYVEALRAEFPRRADGNVLFPFRRLFVVAER